MCLAIPMKVIELKESGMGLVDFGGVQREVSFQLIENVNPGDYVIIHAGFAIGKMDEKSAGETLDLLNECADRVYGKEDKK